MTMAKIYHIDRKVWQLGYFYEKAKWQLSFAFLPHRCFITKKLIWLKYGYKGCAHYRRENTFVPEYRWHDKSQHLIWLLKGKQ